MAARLTLIAGILLLALASTASAHEIVGDHIDTRSELATIDLARVVAASNAATTTRPGSRRAGAARGGPPTTSTTPPSTPRSRSSRSSTPTPATSPTASTQWKDGLQADVSLIGRFMGAQSGGRKAPRFDMGTDCGHEYVDVQVVELPGPRSTYVNNFSAIQTAVRAQLTQPAASAATWSCSATRCRDSPVGYWSGLGTKYTSESPLGLEPVQHRQHLLGAVRPQGRARAGRATPTAGGRRGCCTR